MQNLANRKTSFSQDIPFISIYFNINTSKCTIVRKGKRLFLQDIPFNSICFTINTNKYVILPKGKQLFCKISHFLVCCDFTINTSTYANLEKRKMTLTVHTLFSGGYDEKKDQFWALTELRPRLWPTVVLSVGPVLCYKKDCTSSARRVAVEPEDLL